jgi:hypothetical protein
LGLGRGGSGDRGVLVEKSVEKVGVGTCVTSKEGVALYSRKPEYKTEECERKRRDINDTKGIFGT